jgi:hypothetical protein
VAKGPAARKIQAFDWKNPEPGYAAIWQQRADRLTSIRSMPKREREAFLAGLREHYKENPWDFISDWGVTVDPRRVEIGADPMMPFVMFEKQIDWLKFVVRKWKERRPGVTDKSRDGGLSWLEVALGCTLCLFHTGMNIGYGSVTEDYVDKLGEPKSLFWKARIFMQELPREFKGGWDINRHAPHMRILFPNGSTMTGQSGDNIGRGDRKGIYFVDESSHLVNPKSVDFALSQTTNCRQDISTPKGRGNSFSVRRHSGKVEAFTLHWRDDPRKDEAWYQKQCEDIDDPVVIAQEIDINYDASVTGVVIPHAWVMAAVDAHDKIGLIPSGDRHGALDIADQGKDLNAFVAAHGVLLTDLREWSGAADGDIFDSVAQAFAMSDKNGVLRFKYDGDGVGAGARGDARILNEAREREKLQQLDVVAFRGSASPFDPEGEDVKGRKNKDYYQNAKAQGWWNLRTRFRNTYRLVKENKPCSHDEIICIPSNMPYFTKLIGELTQPTYGQSTIGKMLINKQPDGVKSPNLADAIMMLFARVERKPMKITDGLLAAAASMKRRQRR